MNLLFLGPPGAGKGTLAVRVVALQKIPHISTGNIFRAAIAAQTPLGLKVKKIIGEGALVDDETTIALVKERLSEPDVQPGYILDGFPRTITQARALSLFSTVDRVINFDISDLEVVERLSGRRVCRKCGFNWHKTYNPPSKENVCDKCGGEIYTRDDDKAEAIRKRLVVYRSQTAPLIDYYRGLGVLSDIDARPELDKILREFMEVTRQV
jgi:adenylate kinase